MADSESWTEEEYLIICNLTGVRILQHAFFSETSSPAACILTSPFAGLHLRRALLLAGIPTVCHLPHFAQHAPTDWFCLPIVSICADCKDS